MKKWIFVLSVVLFSLGLLKLGYTEETKPTDLLDMGIPISYSSTPLPPERAVTIMSDVHVTGEIQCMQLKTNSIRSKTTDGLIISNVIMGIVLLITLL